MALNDLTRSQNEEVPEEGGVEDHTGRSPDEFPHVKVDAWHAEEICDGEGTVGGCCSYPWSAFRERERERERA